jgi:hypothetical protein
LTGISALRRCRCKSGLIDTHRKYPSKEWGPIAPRRPYRQPCPLRIKTAGPRR